MKAASERCVGVDEPPHGIIATTRAEDEPEALLTTLADERTRLVTMTITKDGYGIDLVTGNFKADDELVEADVATTDGPHATVMGYLCEALDRRRKAGLIPFSVLPCDNMQVGPGWAQGDA